MGGWKKRDNQAAEYPLSGATYRTYKPEISPTPDGGIFVSVRIDHVRGWLSSDDHAILEVTVASTGMIASARSNIALQGRSISSDVILGSNVANRELGGTDLAVQIGADLVADLSAKLLREKLVEAGRVSFPSVLRHNYNLLFQAIRVDGKPVMFAPAAILVNPPTPADAPATAPEPPTVPPPAAAPESPAPPAAPPEPAPAKKPAGEAPVPDPPANAPLEIQPYASPTAADLPANG